jgi:hypothetical protein
MVKTGCKMVSISEVDQMSIKKIQDKYGFDHFESVVSVLIDYATDPLENCNTFDQYVRRVFPSKF